MTVTFIVKNTAGTWASLNVHVNNAIPIWTQSLPLLPNPRGHHSDIHPGKETTRDSDIQPWQYQPRMTVTSNHDSHIIIIINQTF